MLGDIFNIGIQLFAFVTPISIAGTGIVFFPLLSLWILGYRWTRTVAPFKPGLTEYAFAAFLLASFFASLAGGRPMHSIDHMRGDLYFAIVLFVAAVCRTEGLARKVVAAFLIASVFTGALGVLQGALGISIEDRHRGQILHLPAAFENWPRSILNYISMLSDRSAGTRSHPLTYAECLLFAFGLVMSFLTDPTEKARGRWVWMAFILIGGLMASQSRGPWLASILMTVLLVAARPTARTLKLVVLLSLPCVLFIFTPTLRSRFASIGDQSHHSNAERLHMWSAGFDIFKKHPLLGVGPGNVKAMTVDYQTPKERLGGPWGHLHSTYINLLVERGALGLLAFLLFLAVMSWELFRGSREGTPFGRSLCLGALLGITGFAISGLTETNYNDTEVLMSLYLICGAALSLARQKGPAG
jgi:O-antigen ligase